jgi:HPt (histidine-containing phosphotransfer) domain-containing protein
MSNPVIEAFFYGRALAEVLSEKVESNLTNTLSDLGKLDAELKENVRQFLAEVEARAQKETSQGTTVTNNEVNQSSEDLQETIDELRAEIAHLRSELKQYRNE